MVRNAYTLVTGFLQNLFTWETAYKDQHSKQRKLLYILKKLSAQSQHVNESP